MSDWVACADKLPEVGEWVNVLVDRNEGDYWDRKDKPRFSVHGAQLYDIDGEGYGLWRRWVMSDGGPMGSLNHVTHWMPFPSPPESQP